MGIPQKRPRRQYGLNKEDRQDRGERRVWEGRLKKDTGEGGSSEVNLQ